MCSSKLRILHAASVYYPALRKFLHAVENIGEIDNPLCTNDYRTLCKLMCIEECEDLIGVSLKSENADEPPEFSAEGLVNVETDVQVKYASVLEQYKEKFDEDFEYPCSGCTKNLCHKIYR